MFCPGLNDFYLCLQALSVTFLSVQGTVFVMFILWIKHFCDISIEHLDLGTVTPDDPTEDMMFNKCILLLHFNQNNTRPFPSCF